MAARRPCSRLLVAGGLCGPVDPLIVAQVLGRVVFVEGAVWPRRPRRCSSRRVVVVRVVFLRSRAWVNWWSYV